MFNLENAIQSWKQSLKRSPAFEEGQIREMESHLREDIDRLANEGLREEAAFRRAIEKFGPVEELADEVYKIKTTNIDATPPWRQHRAVPALLPNYLKVAYRNFRRDKLYTGINIIGLAVGLASAILIGWYINHELGYDEGYSGSDRIYRITTDVTGENRTDRFATSAPPVGPALKENFPEVMQYARLREGTTRLVRHRERKIYESEILFADSTFFDLFRLPFSEGEPALALRNPGSVVLSHEAARKYFPGESALGKTLMLDETELYTVTGVLGENIPPMHLDLNLILPYRDFVRSYPEGEYRDWGWISFYNYIMISKNGSGRELQKKLPDLVSRRAGSAADRIKLNLQPVRDIHLSPGKMGEIASTGNRAYIYILGISAILILTISIFNFMNLATARSVRRGREIGVRKVLGANRPQIAAQFLGESVLQSLLALLLSVLLIEGFTNLFGNLFSPVPQIDLTDYLYYGPLMLAAACTVGLLAGLYPALLLTRFKAFDAFRNRMKQSKGGTGVRNLFIIAQFTATIILISGTLVVLDQLQLLRTKDLGFDRDQVLVIPLNSEEIRDNFGQIRNDLSDESGIAGITAGRLALDGGYGTVSFQAEGQTGEAVRMRLYPVYFDFTEVLGMEMAEGRGFSRDFPADTEQGFIINEAAAGMLGWTENAVGKSLRAADYATGPRRVVGVVKDFHYTPLHEEVAPLALFVRRTGMHFMYVRMTAASLAEGLLRVEQVWNRYLPEFPFDYWFLDDRLDSQYQTEERFAHLIRIFATVATIIACFGLFGLVSLMVEQQRKEIGIRKVHGATAFRVVLMISKGYLKLVGISFLLATPIAYVSVREWLENFAYRIDPGAGVFLLAGGIALAISTVTVGGQAFRAAVINPLESLKRE